MGMSPDAKLAWGIDLGDEGAAGSTYDFENGPMPALFGFTEEPPERPDGLEGTPLREWWKANREPYNQRLEAAVPLSFESYGCELVGDALVLKRSLTRVEWATVAVDPVSLTAPTPGELAAFAMVAGHLGLADEDATVVLLLMAAYG